MTVYNVFLYEPYEGHSHVLQDASPEAVKEYLLRNNDFLDMFTIFEGPMADTDTVIKSLGLRRHYGKAVVV